jgi:hypothetical protein
MNLEERLAAVAARLVYELRRDFPYWQIDREESGSWTATHEAWGVIRASSATELREKLQERPQDPADGP